MGNTFTDSSPTPPSTTLAVALARLDSLVDWERRDRSAGSERRMRVDVAPSADLLARMGHPHRNFRAVHVAGSKGKGSTALLIAEGLRRAGYRVGLYTSPHVEHVHERISVDGEAITDTSLAAALVVALDAREEALAAHTPAGDATWFDVLTASACGHFAAESVELAVIECGLGGRLDSTNIVAPVLTVLTRIELEHADMLGDSLAKIAAEKAGILAPGVPAIACGAVYGTEVGECLRAAADLLGTSLVNVPAAMFGSIGARNLALAGAALGQLGAGSGGLVDQDGQALGPHLLTTELGPLPHLPGRLERGDVDGVPVVLDGAHVPASLTAVLGDLKADPALKGPLHCIFGCGRDKDAAGLLKALVPWVDRTLCTRAGSGPHAAPADLAVLATDLGLRAQAVDDPASALIDALRAARAAGGWVLVIGSLHLVGALRSSIRLTPC